MNSFNVWCFHHKKHGFIRLGSYRTCTVTEHPPPRGMYMSRERAETAKKCKSWGTGVCYYGQRKSFPANELDIVEVELTWK